jgi:hydroxyethylthiazole kinase-like uncharacterized protein yjeF
VNKHFLCELPLQSHKYSHGTVAVLAGSFNYAGAAVLCVGGARRGGSGYINFIYTDPLSKQLVLNAYPDIVVKKKIKEIEVDAWVIGPGSPPLSRRFNIPQSKYAVLDSVAMKYAKKIAAEFVVITPHEGEARELGFEVGEGDVGRQGTAIEMASTLNCVVVLKGLHTVVAAPDGSTAIDLVAGPELATAGTGDVLAGLIGSMLASWKPENLSEVLDVVFKAITAHGEAAKDAAKERHPITSTDILKYLAKA